jgi:hypothetical protein
MKRVVSLVVVVALGACARPRTVPLRVAQGDFVDVDLRETTIGELDSPDLKSRVDLVLSRANLAAGIDPSTVPREEQVEVIGTFDGVCGTYGANVIPRGLVDARSCWFIDPTLVDPSEADLRGQHIAVVHDGDVIRVLTAPGWLPADGDDHGTRAGEWTERLRVTLPAGTHVASTP